MISTFAPAKINLYLHVTGRREDGYHFLDSLVTFASVGDRLRLEEADRFSFAMEGPMAAGLSGEDGEKNLVTRAARALGEALGKELKFRLVLTKNLPVASGIGGGSTDAAAALRLLASFWGISLADPRLFSIAAGLGQDVPCCVAAQTCYFRGIGDITDPGPLLPPTNIVLVNPNKAVPTPAVFKARSGSFSSSAPPMDSLADARALAEALSQRENNLTEAAVSICPKIETVLEALSSSKECLLSRMSGSGATCFGLFPDRAAARAAAAALYESYPEWWVVPAFLPVERMEESSLNG